MGQTLEMLLGADPTKIKNIPTGQFEVKRLSKSLGQPFHISYRAGTIAEMKEIGDKAKTDSEEMVWTIYELTTDPDFKSKELREKYGVVRPVDIVSTILLGGEILSLYTAIMRLSGLDRSAGLDIDEIKN